MQKNIISKILNNFFYRKLLNEAEYWKKMYVREYEQCERYSLECERLQKIINSSQEHKHE